MFQHRQIHVWISESDYLLLHEQADLTRESVSALIRRLIKSERLRLKEEEANRMLVLLDVCTEQDEMFQSCAS
jgi:uncharacterized protein (DUF1778 family)